MDTFTTAKVTRGEQCRINAKARSEKKRQAVFDALSALQQEKSAVTKAAVARQAGVSVVFLRKHPDLLQAIEDAEQARSAIRSPVSSSERVKDQVIAALRRRLDEMKQQLAAKDGQLRQKQRDIDRLYGKLAAASPLTDAELRRVLTEAMERLGKSGQFSARQERKQRGASYWYAYRKANQVRIKRYLGTTDKLTLAKLEETANALHEEALGTIGEEKVLNTRPAKPPPDGLQVGSFTVLWHDEVLRVTTPTESYILNRRQTAELLHYLYHQRGSLLKSFR
jgi:hypothetical protein